MSDYTIVVLPTREAADEILQRLNNIQKVWGFVSLDDYYDLADVESTFSDMRRGWQNLNDVDILEVEGGFTIKFSDPISTVKFA